MAPLGNPGSATEDHLQLPTYARNQYPNSTKSHNFSKLHDLSQLLLKVLACF